MSPLKRHFLLGLLICLTAGIQAYGQGRVAVWDPIKGTSERRFTLSTEHLDEAANTVKQGGFKVSRITAQQMNNPSIFSAKQFDVLFMDGICIPKISMKAMRKFADQGGIIVNLGASVPFLIYVKQKPDQTWTMDPPTPKFKWQTNDINRYLGTRYIYDVTRINQGVKHSITPLFAKYFKGHVQLPDGMLPTNWIVPNTEKNVTADYFPLVRSQRIDQKDVIPQVFISRFKGRISIHCLSPYYTGREKVDWWKATDQTLIAFVNLAVDIRNKKINLDDYMHPAIPKNMAAPLPLQTRLPMGSVQPSKGKVIKTWGQFDGSGIELGKAIMTKQLSASSTLPQKLGAGAMLKLSLPDNASDAQILRYRLAYNKDSAGIQIRINDQLLQNQLFVYMDVSANGNFSAPSYADKPIETHRQVFLPANIWGNKNVLTLKNPGKEPIYFDAIQLETIPNVLPNWRLGLGAPWTHRLNKGNVKVPAKYSKTWATMRGGARTSYAGPPSDPDRFKIMDQQIELQLAVNPNLEINLQGTPQWAAIPNRYAEAKAAGRPYGAAADPQKYQQIVEHIINQYGDQIDSYELWNEADSQKYWRGSVEEYVAWCNATIATIKKLDPTARIYSTGMAGFKGKFIHELSRTGILNKIDALAFHPYAGKSPLWDLPYGMAEGEIMALGLDIPVYCNEMGFVYKNAEWFTAPPTFTPDLQAKMISQAMSRLLSNSINAISIFHAGGSKHYYGLIDEKGVPRPAYKVFDDYLQLCHRDGKRIEFAMTPANPTDAPISGIYATAASHNDGSYTIVVNPSMSRFQERNVRIRIPVSSQTTKLTTHDDAVTVQIKHHHNQHWADVVVQLSKRMVIELKP